MSKMSRRLLAFMLLCVFALTAVAGPAARVFAQDEDKELTLTLKPARDTRVSDWLVYVNGAVSDNSKGAVTLPEDWKDGTLYTLNDVDGSGVITLTGTNDELGSMTLRLIKADGSVPSVSFWDKSVARQTLAGTVTDPVYKMDDDTWYSAADMETAILMASDVAAAIEAIGTVSLDSVDAIVNAEALYDKLPDGEKDYVDNHQDLTNARTAYGTMKALADKKAEQK